MSRALRPTPLGDRSQADGFAVATEQRLVEGRSGGPVVLRRQSRRLGKVSRKFIALLLVLTSGCAQNMDDQPRLDAQEAAPFFADRIASRPLPDHAVAAAPTTWQVRPQAADEMPLTNDVFLTGRDNGEPVGAVPASLLERMTYAELLQRGQERYGISCVPCHDATGSGNGMAARRGYPYPPTFHSDRLRSQPLGYFFVVATEGRKKMPAYGELISIEDRWAIAAYVRALQLSQHADVDQLEAVDLDQLKESP